MYEIFAGPPPPLVPGIDEAVDGEFGAPQQPVVVLGDDDESDELADDESEGHDANVAPQNDEGVAEVAEGVDALNVD